MPGAVGSFSVATLRAPLSTMRMTELGSSARAIEEFATEWAQSPVLSGVAPDVAAASHADRLRSTPAGLAAALRGLGTGAFQSALFFGMFVNPVLVVGLQNQLGSRAIAVGAVGVALLSGSAITAAKHFGGRLPRTNVPG